MSFKSERILLLLFGGIGDILLFTPALDVLRREFPKARIDAVIRKDGCIRVLENNTFLNNIIVYDRHTKTTFLERIRLLRQIRKNKYDTTITFCVDFDYKTGLLSFLSGASTRIGPDIRSHGAFYNEKVPMIHSQHFVYRNFDLVKKAGVKQPLNEALKFHLDRKERLFAQQFFKLNNLDSAKKVIGIHPGCGLWRDERRWPKNKFIELINLLSEDPEKKIILMGGFEEKQLVEEILEKTGPEIITSGNSMSLGEFAAIVELCDLFFCNDGGPMNVAVAIGTPTVSIFGPTNYMATEPIGNQHIIINNRLQCSPCIDIYNYKSRACKDLTCLKSISVSKVIEEINKKLKIPRNSLHSHIVE